MYQAVNDAAPEMIKEVFKLREESIYNVRYTSRYIIPQVDTVYHGAETTFR